jgi:hypothetical protein
MDANKKFLKNLFAAISTGKIASFEKSAPTRPCSEKADFPSADENQMGEPRVIGRQAPHHIVPTTPPHEWPALRPRHVSPIFPG